MGDSLADSAVSSERGGFGGRRRGIDLNILGKGGGGGRRGLEKVETRISSFLLSLSPPKRSATPFFFPNRGVPFCSCSRTKVGIRPRERIKGFWYDAGI